MSQSGSDDSLVGQWLLDQYLVVRRLAQGGVASVYLADQAGMDRPAAIKFLAARGIPAAQSVHRFRQEARAASRLNHPKIVTVYNFGELADGSLFLAMEYVEGPSLAQAIAESAPMPVDRALDIAKQCAAGLAYAHQMGVIHRDLKPGNVMLWHDSRGEEQVKLIDFGLARLHRENSDMTLPGDLIGTPRYFSPEQCRGEPVTALCDQYALGLMLYEMLTAEPACRAESAVAYLHVHQHVTPPAPSHHVDHPGVKRIDDVVMRMLAKNPQDRFPNIEAVIAAFERATAQPAPRAARRSGVRAGEASLSRGRRLTRFELVGPGCVDQEGKRALADWGLRLRSGFDSDASFSPESCCHVIGVPGSSWREARQAYRREGVAEDTALFCVDAPLDDDQLLDARHDLPRNVLVGRHPIEPVVLVTALRWIAHGEAVGLNLVPVHSATQLLEVGSVRRIGTSIEALSAAAKTYRLRRNTLRAISEVAEELLMNALLRAPAGRHHGVRGMSAVTLRWVIDPEFVALSVRDAFGSLSADDVMQRTLGKPPVPHPPRTDLEAGGAGVGLRIVSRAAQHVVCAVSAGAWCEFVAFFNRRAGCVGGQSLGLLQMPGRQCHQIGLRLRLLSGTVGSVLRIQLQGEIDESCDLSEVFRRPGAVHLDLCEVSRINSAGIGAVMAAAHNRDRALDLRLERCSHAWVRQMNMIPTLAELGRVDSIMGPYYCRRCDEEQLELLLRAEFSATEPPERGCPRCGARLEFDAPPAEYFSFLQ